MRTGAATSLSGWQPGDPTPDEIEDVCRDIRRTWSDREHYIRSGRRVPGYLTRNADQYVDGWTPPVMATGDDVLEPAD